MRKFENINSVSRQRKICMRKFSFHKDSVHYNMSRFLFYDPSCNERYYRRRCDTGGVNKEYIEAHWKDYKINRRCHRVTGVLCD